MPWVRLNVGGQMMETQQATLTKYPVPDRRGRLHGDRESERGRGGGAGQSALHRLRPALLQTHSLLAKVIQYFKFVTHLKI